MPPRGILSLAISRRLSARSGFGGACTLETAPLVVCIERLLSAPPLHPRETGTASMKARVIVTLKAGVLDPQGKAIEGALTSLGVEGISSVRQGKAFDVEIDSKDESEARARLKTACEKLLANTVIENYHIEI
jgi:phosphoribosylformylglycinamidine synthase